MSLHQAFLGSLAGRLRRSDPAATVGSRAAGGRSLVLPHLAPMRLLEVGVAVLALATGVLIGIGH